jgi:hypothetical protein
MTAFVPLRHAHNSARARARGVGRRPEVAGPNDQSAGLASCPDLASTFSPDHRRGGAAAVAREARAGKRSRAE